MTIGTNDASAKTTGSINSWQELMVTVTADGTTAEVNIGIVELTTVTESLYADDIRLTPAVSEFPTQALTTGPDRIALNVLYFLPGLIKKMGLTRQVASNKNQYPLVKRYLPVILANKAIFLKSFFPILHF